MRWIMPTPPAGGAERKVTQFLWLPMELNGDLRWLEKATILQRYSDWCGEWLYIRWVDEQ